MTEPEEEYFEQLLFQHMPCPQRKQLISLSGISPDHRYGISPTKICDLNKNRQTDFFQAKSISISPSGELIAYIDEHFKHIHFILNILGRYELKLKLKNMPGGYHTNFKNYKMTLINDNELALYKSKQCFFFVYNFRKNSIQEINTSYGCSNIVAAPSSYHNGFLVMTEDKINSNEHLHLYNVAGNSLIGTLTGFNNQICLSKNYDSIAASSHDKTVHMWQTSLPLSLANNNQAIIPVANEVTHMSFNPNDTYLCCALKSPENEVLILDVATQTWLKILSNSHPTKTLPVSFIDWAKDSLLIQYQWGETALFAKEFKAFLAVRKEIMANQKMRSSYGTMQEINDNEKNSLG